MGDLPTKTNKIKSKSRIVEAVHEGARDLHRLGFIDQCRKQKYDLLRPETQALLIILALGQRDVEAGRVRPVADVVARLRARRADA